jgi:hypothetical protein
MEQNTDLKPQAAVEGQARRRSTGVIEMTDAKGRRKTVQLDELNEADRALAEQFGYKPVR